MTASPTVLPPLARRPEIGPRTSVLVAVVSFACSVGIGQLVAAVISPASAPYQAVADAVVRYAPSWAVEFGKTLSLPGLPVGRADKVGLLVGVAALLLLTAVVAGLTSRSSPNPGLGAILGAGLLGLVSILTSPVFALHDIAAPMAAIGTGLSVFTWLHTKALAVAVSEHPAPTFPSPATGAPTPVPDPAVSRRGLLISGTVVGLGAAGAGLGGLIVSSSTGSRTSAASPGASLVPNTPAAPLPANADFASKGTPTFITSNQDFYRIDTALQVPVRAAADWSVKVHGMVDHELTLSYSDLLDRPLEQRPVTLTCVSNEVGGHLISTANFLGVSLRDVLLEAGVQPGADQLFSTSLDGFTCGTPTDVVMEPNRGAMLVLGMNGHPLPLEHGYPVRMVVPGLYGFVSATKWLADLELTTFDAKQSYWLQRGWAQRAPIKTQSRIDRPRPGAEVPSGTLIAAGIAWAQHRGIRAVEVRIDDGPWQPAQLSTEVSGDTWRMWTAELNTPPGKHRLTCRATDATATTQTPILTPAIPDGAAGWPQVDFTAR